MSAFMWRILLSAKKTGKQEIEINVAKKELTRRIISGDEGSYGCDGGLRKGRQGLNKSASRGREALTGIM